MATYTGYAQSTNLVTNFDDSFLNLSINTRSESFAFDGEEGQILPEWVITTGVSATNIDFDEVTRSGIKWGTYSDIFYNRIWVIPSSIDLTGAPTNFSTSVSVWNSYFTQKTMTGVVPTNISGINFSPTTPHTFKALEIQTYNLALTSAAPASINGNYQFIFSDAEDPYLLISGVLSVTFPYFHDWDSGEVVETISYLTDIIETKSGKEQRISLREFPRRQFQYKTLLANSNDYELNALKRIEFHNQLMFGKSKTWLSPIVQDYRYIGYDVPSGTSTITVNTLYHDYYDNGYVLLYNAYNDYEVVRIDSITDTSITLVAPTTKDFYKHSTICPMRQAVFSNESSSGKIIVYEVEDHEVSWDILAQDYVTRRVTTYGPTNIYKGYDVYIKDSNFDADNSMEVYNAQRRLDKNVGLFKIDSRFELSKERTDLNLLLRTKQEISEFLGFLDYRSGRLRPMWYPTFSEDIQIAQAGTSGDTTLKIKNINYSLFIRQASVRRDIMFAKNDGTYLFRRIEGSVDNGDGTETLTIDSSLGFDFSNSDFKFICFIRFCRLDSDTVDLNYSTTDSASTSIKIIDVFETP